MGLFTYEQSYEHGPNLDERTKAFNVIETNWNVSELWEIQL